MDTLCLEGDAQGIALGAQLIKEGKLVAFPTETVYGLGADARNERAVRSIFEVKGRPADNPLIAHVDTVEQALEMARDVVDTAHTLMRVFWPGPLTLVLPRREGALPDVTTAGLSTFAVRCPAHGVARRLIQMAGTPIAAPSANPSGRPSPTTARHVLKDLGGRIPLILDGGACEVGLESTVVQPTREGCVLLRPGGVTVEMLRATLGEGAVQIAQGVLAPLAAGEAALSPGMKHKHYAPLAQVVVVNGRDALFAQYDCALQEGARPLLLTHGAQVGARPLLLTHGAQVGARWAIELGEHPEKRLFSALREADEAGATLVLFEAMPQSGMGYAIMNRMLRAAGFAQEE